jgi:3-hydroxyisobutyrate dehydrogenase-like beta-hydroxyacid dehydrogenase
MRAIVRITSPVLGNPDFAQARKLFVLAAGPPSRLEKVRPLLKRLGQRLFFIGEDAALANLVKLAKRRGRSSPRLRCPDEFVV